ncbi:sensor domain-containing protein [Mycobacterium sp. 050128]|uniref:sensor domain-containing protein n=1 Tax=Mycobacterium sp. 050128 TaxID=3096112 RepID=UPI002ED96645
MRVLALLAVALLTAGCVNTVAGMPKRAVRPASTVAPLEQILPTDDEVKAAVGNDLPAHSPPATGGIDVLPNGIRDDSAAAPIECIGATDPLLRVVYEKGPIRGVATQTYWNYDSGVAVSSAHAGVVRLASSADAQRLFASFVAQWQKCAGTTVTMNTHDSENTELYSKVIDVKVEGPVLSVTLSDWDNHTTPPAPNEHAVGVESDVIVDVEAADQPGVQAGTRAIDLVKVMLRKVSSTN